MDEHQQRTCIGCRKPGNRTTLLRFVRSDGVLVWDAKQRMPGRGAYVHPTAGCVANAEDTRRWERAFRLSKGAVTPSEVRTLFEALPQGVTGGRKKGGAKPPSEMTKRGKIRL